MPDEFGLNRTLLPKSCECSLGSEATLRTSTLTLAVVCM
jgi:hypothetical protein